MEGFVHPDFAPVSEKLHQLMSKRSAKGGAAVAVFHHGELVVDVWTGARDAVGLPWERETMATSFSTTKGVVATVVHRLVDRGELSYDDLVVDYWPEFGSAGKDQITLRHLLTHQAALHPIRSLVPSAETMLDWDRMVAILADAEPVWPPGTRSGYHALNQGHLLGEVIRRIDGRMLGQFLADEITGPLGADFHIGLNASEFGRVSNVIPPPPVPMDPAAMDPDGVLVKTYTGPAPQADVSWTPEWRQACIGAANGHGNARSVARIQAVIANGGTVDGVKLLSPDTIQMIFEEQANGVDQVLGLPVRFGMGYALHSIAVPYLPEGNYAYWGGWGGSSVIVDIDRKISFAYMMNRMDAGLLGDMRTINLATEVFKK